MSSYAKQPLPLGRLQWTSYDQLRRCLKIISFADTEMEADVEPSRETEERLRVEEEAKRQLEAQMAAEAAAREAQEAAERDLAAAKALDSQRRMQVGVCPWHSTTSLHVQLFGHFRAPCYMTNLVKFSLRAPLQDEEYCFW